MATTHQAPAPQPGAVDGRRPPAEDAGIGDLVAKLSEQTSRLVRDELHLAEIETRRRLKETGVGAGALAAAGGAGFLGAGALVAAAIWGVHRWLAGWLSCLVVGGALLMAAGMAALVGVKALQKGAPPVPRAAMESTRADVEAVKEALHQ